MGRLLPIGRRLGAYARLYRDARELARSSLFDASWYRARYPDLGRVAYPALHYLRRGAGEGRAPGPAFDGDLYCARHPDVAMSDANPLLHYLRTGAAEGRAIDPARTGVLPRLGLDTGGYRRWIAMHDTYTDATRASLHAALAALPRRPRFLVTTAEATPALRQSLQRQLHADWRLACTREEAPTLGGDDWDYLLRLPPGTRLAESALAHLALAAGDDGVAALHADWDFLDDAGQRYAPCFQPTWEPDLEQARPAICAVRRGAPEDGRGPGGIRHVPRILFHRAASSCGDGSSGPAPLAPAGVGWPMVSVIVPSRDNRRLLSQCLAGLLTGTDYPRMEVIVIDHDSRAGVERLSAIDSRVHVLPYRGPFNWSAMNNAAAGKARGDVLLLLNDDVAILRDDWLMEMVGLAVRPGIGAVGAKLLYPNALLQHGGISLGPGAVARHLLRQARHDDAGHAGMLARRRSVAAVTGACLAIRRDVFIAAGGLEEAHLGITNADVDLCLRVRALGLRVVWTPFATLTHHEAASRGLDITDARRARLRRERAYLVQAWGDLAQHDPYLNPNLDLVGEDLALASPPRHGVG